MSVRPDDSMMIVVCSLVVVFVVMEWHVQRRMGRWVTHTDLSVGPEATRCVVHCSHGLGQSADSFGVLFASVASTHNLSDGVRWISHTRPTDDVLDGDEVVARCRALGTRAVFVGHSLGAIPAVRAAERWTSLGLHTVGVLLLAPAVDHRDCVWNTGPVQSALHSVLGFLTPGGWNRLLDWVPWCPVVLWWIVLSVLGNGWAPLEQIIHERRGAVHGLSSVRHLMNRDVGKHFNKRISDLIRRNVCVVVQYDPDQSVFMVHKIHSGPTDPVILHTMIDELLRRHPLVHRSVLAAGSAGHFPHELQPGCVVSDINWMLDMDARREGKPTLPTSNNR